MLSNFVDCQPLSTCNEELDDNEETDTGANVGGLSVHAGQHVDDGLTHCDHHAKQLLCTVEQCSVLRGVSNL